MIKLLRFCSTFLLLVSLLAACKNKGGIKLNDGPIVGRGVERSGNVKYIKILEKKTIKFDPEIGTWRIYMKVKNNSKYLCEYSHFEASLYDANGNMLGIAIGNGINIPAGKEKTVDLIALDISEEPAKYEIQIEDVTFQ
jgi:hypothetical protein